MKHRKGFTLTELIIVLVVVILIVLIFIVYQLLRSPGHDVWSGRCASQLRGLGNATAMYHNDFEGKNPVPWTDKVVKAGFGTGWYNDKGENTYTRWYDTTWKDWDKQPTVGGGSVSTG